MEYSLIIGSFCPAVKQVYHKSNTLIVLHIDKNNLSGLC